MNAKNQGVANSLEHSAVRVSVADLIQVRHYANALNMKSGLVLSKQTGNRVSAFKGRGMDYEESRRYQPGDDRRNLDWRVMARTGKPYTKLYREERERPVYLCLDLSPGMHFATRRQFKSVVAAKCLALLGWAAFGHGDRVGGVVFGGIDALERRPARGKRAILNWIHDVCREQNWRLQSVKHKDYITDQLARVSRVNRPGSLLAVASDWRNFSPAIERQVLKLSQHNTLVLIFVYDLLEKELPPPGLYSVSADDQVLTLDSRGREQRKQYGQEFVRRYDAVQRLAGRAKAAFVDVVTHEDPVKKMLRALG